MATPSSLTHASLPRSGAVVMTLVLFAAPGYPRGAALHLAPGRSGVGCRLARRACPGEGCLPVGGAGGLWGARCRGASAGFEILIRLMVNG